MKRLLPWAAVPASAGQRDILWAEVCSLKHRPSPKKKKKKEFLTNTARAFAALHRCLLLRGTFFWTSDIPLQQAMSIQTYFNVRPAKPKSSIATCPDRLPTPSLPQLKTATIRAPSSTYLYYVYRPRGLPGSPSSSS